ncbi:MAG: hypothetical protein IKL18_09205 [Oscillospiraceae bacterium]|nr:hypothetical protein [Oscillospiraceae bacterium]MBR6658326.1 hypothetical protein [Oscillospiraceae bacterium]
MDRKYYISNTKVCYQSAGWFSTAKFYTILFYEEDGKFFELITGKFLGIRKNDVYDKVYSDEFGYTFQLSGWSAGDYIHCISAEKFAGEAREYMQDKNKIIPHINEQFEQWRKEHQKKLEEERKKLSAEEIKKAQDKDNINWLNNVLNNRN